MYGINIYPISLMGCSLSVKYVTGDSGVPSLKCCMGINQYRKYIEYFIYSIFGLTSTMGVFINLFLS